MEKQFRLEIITPTRQFLETSAEAITVTCNDGELSVLSGHAPLVVALDIGELRIKENGNWRSAFHSEGFMEVRPDEVLVFSQACEWPEEIDVARAERALERSTEKLRQQQSIFENRHTKISLTRAMVRLKVSQTKK